MRNLWNAVYGATFAELVTARMQLLGGEIEASYLEVFNEQAESTADIACEIRWHRDPNPDSYDDFPRCRNCSTLNNLVPHTCPRQWCVNNHPLPENPMPMGEVAFGAGYDAPLRVTFPASPESLKALDHDEIHLGVVIRRDEGDSCLPPASVFVPTSPTTFYALAALTSLSPTEVEAYVKTFVPPPERQSAWERIASDEDPLGPPTSV